MEFPVLPLPNILTQRLIIKNYCRTQQPTNTYKEHKQLRLPLTSINRAPIVNIDIFVPTYQETGQFPQKTLYDNKIKFTSKTKKNTYFMGKKNP